MNAALDWMHEQVVGQMHEHPHCPYCDNKRAKGYDVMLTIKVQRILHDTPSPLVIELGACDGRYTHAIRNACLSGAPTIYSFEPDPRNVPVFLRNAPDGVIFVPAAAGSITGKTSFYLASPQANGEIGSSSISHFKDQTKAFPWCEMTGTVQVDCWRLDDFCAQRSIKYIDFLFADIQGAERLMIEGAREIFKSTRYFWTEFEGLTMADEGTCYAHSSSLERIWRLLGTDWQIAEIAGGDALLVNKKCTGNPHSPIDLLYAPVEIGVVKP